MIGAGTGGATKSILPALGQNFLSYTFTDVSAGFFENAATIFSDYKDQIQFKVLDLEKDPLIQGYTEGSYDVIVGSLVIHATTELKKTLRYLRRLLKPGGFLVIGEGSDNCTTGGFIFGPLPGWWLGVDEGRTLTPFISGEEWDRILKATGFSGVDTATPKDQEDVYGVTVWVAQATDEEVQFIREPLSAPPEAHLIEKLAIVGGKTAKTAHLADSLQSVLKPYAVDIRVFETLADVDYSFVNATSTVVSLADLDGAVFDDIQPRQWQDLKQMFEVGKTILWLTSGREAEEPYANMMVGFGRTARLETPGLSLQFLDVADATIIDTRHVAEALLRLQVEVPEDRTDLLWTVESELVIDASDRQLVPRLRAIPGPNDRYNSAFRPIQHEIDISQSAVHLQHTSSGYILSQVSLYGTSDSSEAQVELRITHSLLYALRTAGGYQFLVLGEAKSTGTKYMALVSSLTSLVQTPAGLAVPFELVGVPEATLLSLAATYMVGAAICDPVFTGETLVLHNAPNLLSRAINTHASEKCLEVIYTTDSAEEAGQALWVPPCLSRAEAVKLVPQGTRTFVGLSNQAIRRSDNELTLRAALPRHVRKETVETLYSPDATPVVASSARILGNLVQRALEYARSYPVSEQEVPEAPVLVLETLVGQHTPAKLSTVVDWKASPRQLAHVCRLDSRPMFKADKTYWMVGLSGALGISLCDWMIDRGARYLVLTSRNPKVAPEWVESHARKGVKVTIIPW